jgi:hypothetical protein
MGYTISRLGCKQIPDVRIGWLPAPLGRNYLNSRQLLDYEGKLALLVFGSSAFAKKANDLLFKVTTAGSPALSARNLFHASSQAPKVQHPWTVQQMLPQLLSQAGEKQQLAAVSSLGGQKA